MPKKLDYPQASFDKALKLSEAVHSLGGNCSQEIAGDKLGLSGTSGGFRTLVGASVKFNLIKIEKGILHTSDLFKAINLSYTPEEKTNNLRLSFLSPAIFNQLYQKLKGRELPVGILDKILIKEYDVDGDSASRVSKYFINGAKAAHLIDDNNILITINEKESELEVITEAVENIRDSTESQTRNDVAEQQIIMTDKYLIQIMGPGLNARLEINDTDDLIIVEATLNKIKKKLSNGTD